MYLCFLGQKNVSQNYVNSPRKQATLKHNSVSHGQHPVIELVKRTKKKKNMISI